MTVNALPGRESRCLGQFPHSYPIFAEAISYGRMVNGCVPSCFSEGANSQFGHAAADNARRREWLRVVVVGVIGIVVTLKASIIGYGAPTPLRTINTAREILELDRSEASRQYPVQLRGVITAFHLADKVCFLQDETAGVYLYGVNTILEHGQLVEVTGVSSAGRFAPIIEAKQVKVMGRAELPSPRQVSIDLLDNGNEDSQWVALTGIIHAQTNNADHLVLDLAQGKSVLKIQVLNIPQTGIPDLVDSKVRVSGVAGTYYNAKGQLTGFHLLTPSLEQVEVIEPARPDPFALPAIPIGAVLSYSTHGVAGHRVHVRGKVILYRPGELLSVQDESGGVKVRTTERTPLNLGDTVDVVGFPTRSGYAPVLQSSVFRIAAPGSPLQPRKLSTREAASGDHENELVQIAALLTHAESSYSSGLLFFFEADGLAFRALLPQGQFQASMPVPEEGSQVEVTGLCAVEVNEAQKPDMRLELRSLDDIRVVTGPPWWKRKQVRVLGNVAAGLALLSFVGIGLLHRQVRVRTRAIRQREAQLEERYRELFENANDIIYRHELNGKLILLNHSGQQALGYSEEEVRRLNLSQLMSVEQFGSVMRDLNEKSARGGRSAFEIELIGKQGRRIYLEVNARLLYQDGKPIGVQGIARDVTERKAAEAALREQEEQLRRSLHEREQLGRDLHDSFIQSIYAVGLVLDGCRRSLTEEQGATKKCLGKCVADLNGVIRDVRSFILGLEPQVLNGHELKAALKSLILTMDQPNPGRFELHIEQGAPEQLGARQATQLLHVAREAMTNSLRHSQAQRIAVSLYHQHGGVCFEVRDDGVGFDPDQSISRGQGLRNIEARARDLNAECQILSRPGAGTRVILVFSHDTIHSSS